MFELFVDIKGFEGMYQVSNFGRVKSLQRKNHIFLKQKCKPYPSVVLFKDNVAKTCLVHRLVATAFIPNPLNKREVNHIDGNKLNNHVDNLQWVTPSENSKHAFDNGLSKVLRGCDNGAAKLSPQQINQIRQLCRIGDKSFGIRALAKKFNVSAHTISRIVHFETFKFE